MLGDRPGVTSLAWQPHGTRLVMGAGHGELWLWDALRAAETPVSAGHRSSVQGLAWSEDGRSLASADEDGRVVFWDVGKLERMAAEQSVPPASDGVISVALSTDGTRIASGGSNLTLHAWDALGNQVSVAEDMPGPILGLTAFGAGFLFSPLTLDGRTDLALWDRLDRRPRFVLRADMGAAVIALAPSPDSRYVACGDVGGSVWVWELETNRLLVVHLAPEALQEGSRPRRNQAESIAWSPDSSMLACVAEHSTVVWSAQAKEPAAVLYVDAAPAPDEDAPDSPVVLSLGLAPRSGDCAWSPDGRFLAATARGQRVAVWRVDGWARHLDLACPGNVTALAWSNDGRRLVSGDDAGTIRVWGVHGGVVEASAICVSGVADLTFGSDASSLYAADDGAAWLGRPILYSFLLSEPAIG